MRFSAAMISISPFEVESGEVAFQVSQAIERHGLDTETMRTLPVERIGELVDDI